MGNPYGVPEGVKTENLCLNKYCSTCQLLCHLLSTYLNHQPQHKVTPAGLNQWCPVFFKDQSFAQ